MIKNYFKIAWRNLVKNRTYSFINIFGLTIGITSFLLLALYLVDELSFDRFHKNASRIFRIVEDQITPEGTETKVAATGYMVSQSALTNIPDIERVTRIASFRRLNIRNTENSNVFYETFTLANEGFLTTFNFEFLEGDKSSALSKPNSVIITKETAEKYFNSIHVLGKILIIDGDSSLYKITGVLQNFPSNSHLSYNLLFSESSITNDGFRNFINSDWNSGMFSTYLLLHDKADPHKIETKINKLVMDNSTGVNNIKRNIVLQPLKDIHFKSGDIEGVARLGNITYIYIFSIIALFVLLIACINYMNLSTAGFASRAKEIAVRKVAGASRQSLVSQFLSEAFTITVIASLVALVFVKLALPRFNLFTQKNLTLGLHTDYRIWLGVLVIMIFVGLISGIYPALFQSTLKPLQLFKSKIKISSGNLSIRRSLVVFQFTISIIMIIATCVVYLQLKYVSSKDMGFKKDQLVVVDINSGKIRRGAETIKAEFSKLPQVTDVSVSSRVPGEWKDIPNVRVRGEKIQNVEGENMYFLGIDDQFLKTFQIPLTSGRNFSSGSLSDSSAVIINEFAAKQLGITSPQEQIIEFPGETPLFVRVVGIVKDFNFQSLHDPLAPMILGFQNNPIQSIDYFTARVATGDISKTLATMDDILHSIDQNHLFEYHFLDKQWDLFYREDQIQETIFIIMALLTVLIACLGLFGLATFATQSRIKEIGIRKVLGASALGITSLLSKEFIRLIAIAIAIASPIAYFFSKEWLHRFAFHISISWWIFALVGIGVIAFAILTICFQAFKAAVANPITSLRSE
ncbi:MAG: ABC transporter permease [Saprospiraceae bacterium]